MALGIVVGVDEAGRGSLVGDLIVAGFAVEEARLGELQSLGVRDSKQLSPAEREELYREISGVGFFTVEAVRPWEIDGENINILVTKAVEEIVSRIVSYLGVHPSLVVVDKYGDVQGLKLALTRLGIEPGSILVEEKADSRYPVVSAASIVAKVVRDARLQVLRRMYGVRGSGYPSDPETREWVREVFARGEAPRVIRYTWSTVRKLGGPWRSKKAGRSRSLDEFLGG
ncbi:ribonuclease HII [Aeropyrum pernix]|uniref:Ribonuclease HII n=1 Tax=Aeropyrum pernix TaxID=56636 RepID=A0A401H8S7_AERPX|nr:ribonuclease HII [Aeropyrum pernix]GBF08739.1 ribonuclease HII [Aeropyrum pernix]